MGLEIDDIRKKIENKQDIKQTIQYIFPYHFQIKRYLYEGKLEII